MDKYNPITIERKWRDKWEKDKLYQPSLDKAKKPFYNLMMFPYPSAEGLHVGSVFTFTGVDTYGRFKRMQGFDVFEPMGLDGFGIHSENYALKVGRHPKEQAKISEENFYRQLRSIGNSFDWSRKVETYDSRYYKWTQWIFIELFKRGLAYRKKSPVNFCPSCKTVLADEQVIDGRCERCQSIVEKRDLEQWFFKITEYAERLLNNIPKLNWTSKVKIAQEQWIGKKEGTVIKFLISNSQLLIKEIEVFTTRGDTLYGATFLVIAPEHPIVALLLNSKFPGLAKRSGAGEIRNPKLKEIKDYVERAKKKTEQERIAEGKEKTGVFTGLYAINPINQEKLPVWVADYALIGYGTGALFGDAHDERDVVFAKKYGIPLKVTLVTGDKKRDARILNFEECFTGDGTLIDSGEFSGLTSSQAREKVADWLSKRGRGGRITTYHLRDWLISRQRYWGPPIPMIFCKKCDWQPVPEKDLPVLLPDIKDWKPTGTGEGPLATLPSFVNTICPKCGGKAVRETDVSDTFLDSSWYFFRYLATDVKEHPLHQERNKRWLPVTMYIGGAEHSVLHLLYSRFITMVFKDMGLISFDEPYARFYAHGLIIKEGAKMSKSRGNVVNPDEYLKKYGADTLRCYLRFVGPFDQGGDFRDTGIEGMHKFLKRVWKLVAEVSSMKYKVLSIDKKEKEKLDRVMHKAIKKLTEDLENLRFNIGVAHLMEYYNVLSDFYTKYKILDTKYCKTLVLLLAPFTPFLAEELWQQFQGKGERGKGKTLYPIPYTLNPWSVHLQPWPTYDPKMLEQEEITIVVQINGKVRDTLKNQKSKIKSQKYVEEIALKREKVKRYLEGKAIKKVVYVPGKIINFVASD